MVKLETIQRTQKDSERRTKMDLHRVQTNTAPDSHPFQRAREFQRAVLAAKTDKMFAQPFVGALDGHSDGVSCMAKSLKHTQSLASGSWDGEIKYWDLVSKECLFSTFAHQRFVKGISFDHSGNFLYSCGDDNEINIFSINKAIGQFRKKKDLIPASKLVSSSIVQSLDSSYSQNFFVTGGETVQLWSQERSLPVQTWNWGVDTVTRVRFNPVEPHLIACTSLDRGIYIYDIRGKSALQKTVLMNKSSAFCWNPQEAFNFTVGNEDGNTYSLDMRKMDQIKIIHKDHIGAM